MRRLAVIAAVLAVAVVAVGGGIAIVRLTELHVPFLSDTCRVYSADDVVRLTPDHLAWLVGQLSEIIAKGRPLCPLCGVSVDTDGHACVRANGHIQQPIPDEQTDESEEAGP